MTPLTFSVVPYTLIAAWMYFVCHWQRPFAASANRQLILNFKTFARRHADVTRADENVFEIQHVFPIRHWQKTASASGTQQRPKPRSTTLLVKNLICDL